MKSSIRPDRLPRGIAIRNGAYYYSFTYRGTRVRRCLGPASAVTVEDAVNARNLAIAEAIRTGEALPQRRRAVTMKELARRYIETFPAGSSRRTLVANYFRHLTRLLGADLPVDQLSHVRLVGYRQARLAEPVRRRSTTGTVTTSTVNRELSALRAALNWAERQGMCLGRPGNLFSRLSRADRRTVFPREAPSAEPARLTDDDIARLCAAMPAPYRPVVRLAVLTGCRLNELVGLDWAEVTLAGANPYIRPRRTKSGRPRTVPLCRAAVALLPRRPKGGGLVFLGRYGGKLTRIGKAWRTAREAAGLPEARFHDLRHEWATRYIENGGDLRTLMEVGGWSSLALVQRYSRASIARAAEVMERMTAASGTVIAPTAWAAEAPELRSPRGLTTV